jgi:hypothetical protein
MNCKCGRDMIRIRNQEIYWCLNCGRLFDIFQNDELWYESIISINFDVCKSVFDGTKK